MTPTCLMWLVWQERNTRIFEDKARTLENLKCLLFRTLFLWTRVWGCTNCTVVSDFLVLFPLALDLFVFVFLFKVFIIVHMMFNFFSIKVLLPIKKMLNRHIGLRMKTICLMIM